MIFCIFFFGKINIILKFDLFLTLNIKSILFVGNNSLNQINKQEAINN